jgi:hypothetical protein
MTNSAERVRRAQASIAFAAKREVAAVWPKLLTMPPDRVAVVMAELLHEIGHEYGNAAGSLAADYYDDLREAAKVGGRFVAAPSEMPPMERFEALSRWGVGPMFGAAPDVDKALSLMLGGLSRIVLNGGRDTISDAVAADPATPTFARHASANACAFCAMVASRGAVYTSAASAGVVVGRGAALSTNIGRTKGRKAQGIKTRGKRSLGDKYHDFCHCTAVPVWPGQEYQEAPYVAKWRDAYANAPGTPGEALNLKDTLSSMRAELGTR